MSAVHKAGKAVTTKGIAALEQSIIAMVQLHGVPTGVYPTLCQKIRSQNDEYKAPLG